MWKQSFTSRSSIASRLGLDRVSYSQLDKHRKIDAHFGRIVMVTSIVVLPRIIVFGLITVVFPTFVEPGTVLIYGVIKVPVLPIQPNFRKFSDGSAFRG